MTRPRKKLLSGQVKFLGADVSESGTLVLDRPQALRYPNEPNSWCADGGTCRSGAEIYTLAGLKERMF